MWNQLFETGLDLLRRDPRYRNWSDAELAPKLQQWIVGEDYPGRPKPHENALDLVCLYASNLMNSEAPGPTPENMRAATDSALGKNVTSGVLQRFQSAELAEGYLRYMDHGGRLVAAEASNEEYRRQLRQLARSDWTGLDGLMLPQLVDSIYRFGDHLVTRYGGSAARYHQDFAMPPSAEFPNRLPMKRMQELLPGSRVGVQVAMNFLKDSQISAFTGLATQDPAAALIALKNSNAGCLVNPSANVMGLMFWITGRAKLMGVKSSQLTTLRGLENRYAEGTSRLSRPNDYLLRHERPQREAGLWDCVEDIQRYAKNAGVAPVCIDRVLHFIGSGDFIDDPPNTREPREQRFALVTSKEWERL